MQKNNNLTEQEPKVDETAGNDKESMKVGKVLGVPTHIIGTVLFYSGAVLAGFITAALIGGALGLSIYATAGVCLAGGAAVMIAGDCLINKSEDKKVFQPMKAVFGGESQGLPAAA